MRQRKQGSHVETALANFALTFAKALLVLSVVLFILISPEQKKEDGAKPQVEYMITMDWSGDLKYDVDIWLRNPADEIVYYNNKQAGTAFLERDDLGKDCNSRYGNNQLPSDHMTCEEVLSLRGRDSGEYVISVILYSANGAVEGSPVSPALVKFKIQQINPSVMQVWAGESVLTVDGEERHVTRFLIDHNGQIGHFDQGRPILLRSRATK